MNLVNKFVDVKRTSDVNSGDSNDGRDEEQGELRRTFLANLKAGFSSEFSPLWEISVLAMVMGLLCWYLIDLI